MDLAAQQGKSLPMPSYGRMGLAASQGKSLSLRFRMMPMDLAGSQHTRLPLKSSRLRSDPPV
jgi:hypothetical protein